MIRNNTLLSSCRSSHWGESAMVEEANWDCCNFPFSSYWWRSLEKSGQKVRKQWQQQQSVSLWLFLWKVEASGFYCFQYTILSLSGQRSILPTKVRDFRIELNLNFFHLVHEFLNNLSITSTSYHLPSWKLFLISNNLADWSEVDVMPCLQVHLRHGVSLTQFRTREKKLFKIAAWPWKMRLKGPLKAVLKHANLFYCFFVTRTLETSFSTSIKAFILSSTSF